MPLVLVVLGCAFLIPEFPCTAMRRGCLGGALCALLFDLLVRSQSCARFVEYLLELS